MEFNNIVFGKLLSVLPKTTSVTRQTKSPKENGELMNTNKN